MFHKWHVEPRALFKCKLAEGHAIMGMRQCEHPNISFEGNVFTVEKIGTEQ